MLRTIALGRGVLTIAVAAQDGRGFVVTVDANDFGSVGTIDMRSGALVRTTRVGASPGMLAVDGRTGRLFGGNGGSASVSMLATATSTTFAAVYEEPPIYGHAAQQRGCARYGALAGEYAAA